MRGIHLPVWLGAADLPSAVPFAVLFGAQAAGRTLLLTVIPLQALALLGDAQRVSALYFGVSICGLAASLTLPFLIHAIRRRRVIGVGTAAIVASSWLLANDDILFFAPGMFLYVFGFVSLDVNFNLYVLDRIPRREVSRFEPMRVVFAGAGFMIGPWLGVYLKDNVAAWLPYAMMAVVVLLLYAYFLYLRFSDSPTIQAAKRPPPNPLAFFPHFFRQKRLRLAWMLAVGRSAWWSMYFIYAPIYCVEAGLGAETGGALVSVASGTILIVPLWARLIRRFGMRRMLVVGYSLSAAASLVVAAAMGWPWVGVAALFGAALATSVIDGAGNALFLRAVHPHERAEMTAVFSTFRDTAQTVPPGVFALLLQLFALPAVFIGAGLAMAVMARYARFVPKRY